MFMYLRPLDGFNVQRAIQSGRELPFDISTPPRCDFFFSFLLFFHEKILSKSPDGRLSGLTPHISPPQVFCLCGRLSGAGRMQSASASVRCQVVKRNDSGGESEHD